LATTERRKTYLLPERYWANSGLLVSAGSRSMSASAGRLAATVKGSLTGVGITREKQALGTCNRR
jgi:hypothetical protein